MQRPIISRDGPLSQTTEYKTWQGLRRRCLDPNDQGYGKYGAKGIRPCQGWDSFPAFLADMGEKPNPELSIDRIDPTLGYHCGHCEECVANGWKPNCRWATVMEQAANRTNMHLLTYDGVTLHIAEWSRRVGLSAVTINQRLNRGWSVADALHTPSRRKRI